MGFKKVLQRVLALLIIGGALVFGMSGVYHEAPWILKPLIGSVKVELGGKRISATEDSVRAVIGKRDVKQLDYFTNLKSADFRGSTCYEEIIAWSQAHPEVTVLYSVPLPNGQLVDSTAQELDLTWMTTADVQAVRDALMYLPNINAFRFGDFTVIKRVRISFRDQFQCAGMIGKLHEITEMIRLSILCKGFEPWRKFRLVAKAFFEDFCASFPSSCGHRA